MASFEFGPNIPWDITPLGIPSHDKDTRMDSSGLGPVDGFTSALQNDNIFGSLVDCFVMDWVGDVDGGAVLLLVLVRTRSVRTYVIETMHLRPRV